MSDDQAQEQQQSISSSPPAFTDESVIKLNDQEYRYGDLNDNAKQLIGALQASEQQMQNVRNQLGLIDIGRRALAAQLRVAIENPEALEQPEAGTS
jgi:hypothetical protein